ncbi:protein strawberry notch homolog 1-like [Gigantopelta aegis]|uniref:protein strawberry notch homolog 1-like n=1 Tax=Gigantopelta aegis TaxID=1735272 RepID=UPI001B88AC9E|nr:protein strawberry notch homolog 1-like [Gigantopelta aegis]
MATEANNSFQDLLSAALDESGITGNDLEDFGFDVAQSSSGFSSLTGSGTEYSLSSSQSPVIKDDTFRQFVTTSSFTRTGTSSPIPGQTIHRPVATHAVQGQTTMVPKIIQIPNTKANLGLVSGISTLPANLSRSLLQGGSPNQPRVITIRRVGSGSNVTTKQTITLAPQSGAYIVANDGKTVSTMIDRNALQLGVKTTLSGNGLNGRVIQTGSPIQVVSKVGLSGGKVLSGPVSSTVSFSTNGANGIHRSASVGQFQTLTHNTVIRGNVPNYPTSSPLHKSVTVSNFQLQNKDTDQSYSHLSALQAFSQLQRLKSGDTVHSRTIGSLSSISPATLPVPSGNLPTFVSNANERNAPFVNGTSIPTSVSNKDVSRLWSNDDVRLKTIQSQRHYQSRPNSALDEEEVEEEVEQLGRAETYSEYMPPKLKIGEKHPDPVVETSSLSSVEPPDVYYKLCIPENIIDACMLSALQLETIVYSGQRHQNILPSGHRAGFLIGDGAGVGKGRTIAGIIYENYLQGRKRAIWLSVSTDLKVDSERDLRDIGASKIDVHALNKFKYAKISSKENGSVKKGVIFSTYSSLIGESQSGGKYKTRLKQLLKWCGKDFDGCIVFDECHKAKNLCPVGSSKPTKTGQTVLELQNRLPKARVIYASATGASEPKNMAYMTRLGLWGLGTPFKEFNDFIQAVERRGVGAMELVAMDMKLRGMYIARQLSFHGVSFRIEEIPLPKNFKDVYDSAVELWVEAREKFQQAADFIDAEQRMKKSMWGQFWSAHQRFFKYLCISAKVARCVQLARDAVKSGKCVVIGLQSTGEARTLEQVEEMGGELNDFVSTAKGVFQTLVEKHFPAPNRRKAFDIFGISSFKDNANNKRKREVNGGGNHTKKLKMDSLNSGSSDSSSDSGPSDLDLSLSDSSDSESEVNSDNSNPFGAGSDSDDDPWLKKKSKKSKPKEKKKKVPKEKKKKKKSKKNDFDEDEKFDRQLAAAGLLSKNGHNSFDSTPNPDSMTNNYSSSQSLSTNEDGWDKALSMKSDLLNKIEALGDQLPPNTLDQLIDELGGPDNVAEMTGRKGRVVSNDDGGISYESRSEVDVPLEILNLTEKQRFMDGEKCIAIISEAASSGISLQSDRRVINQKRRVHITLELPWSADRAIQQFGRTHRSNQVNAPEYVFLISELAGERRFAATVAKRLESLGALTHGDRRATETRDLSRFNIDNKFGRTALEVIMKCVLNINGEVTLVPTPSNYVGNFFEDAKKSLIGVGMVTVQENSGFSNLEKDYNNISRFLNRILGMKVAIQNALFMYFTETLTTIILEAKRNGRWDMGILDLGSGQERVHKLETQTFLGNTATNTAKTELTTISVERGMSWLNATDLWRKCVGTEEGFYLSHQERNLKRTSVLVVIQGKNKKHEKLYNVYRPNTGLQPRCETMEEIRKKYKKVLPDQAQTWWDDQYYLSTTCCSHAYWRGNCRRASLGLSCEIGLRTRTYHVLSGSVLSVWSKVESVLTSMPGASGSKMQIIRLKTDDGHRIVGSLIPGNCVKSLISILSQDSAKTYTEKHEVPDTEPAPLSMPMLF